MRAANGLSTTTNGELMEKVILGNDLSGLTGMEKTQYVRNVCHTIGLNPVTKPIQLIKFQGKEVPYFTKDATEQLRKLHKVSLSIKEAKVIDDIYMVIAEACLPDGRTDSSTGAIVISGLKGDAKANAIMKAETKAKRRVTLSICGLGFMDESELETLPNVNRRQAPATVAVNAINVKEIEIDSSDFSVYLDNIKSADTVETLQSVFKEATQRDFRNDTNLLNQLIEAKDNRKLELMQKVEVKDEAI